MSQADQPEQTGAPEIAAPGVGAQVSDPSDVTSGGERAAAAAAGTEEGAGFDAIVPEEGEAQLIVRRARRRRVRTVDFSQPTKFTAELRRRILRVLGPFCEAFATRLSSELRVPVELAVADSSQLTWSAAKAQLPASAIAVALDVAPIERQMLLGFEPSAILQALECLLGGVASQAPSERRLSEIDWALTRGLLQAMIGQLGPAWRDLGGLQLALGEIDLEGDAGVMVALGEPTFAVTFASRIDGLPSSISLLIPWAAIEPVAGELLGVGSQSEQADPQQGRAVQRGLAGARVLLRAEVGSARMAVEQVLALTPGTTLTLGERAEEGVQLFAEGVPLGYARPGLHGARRAIKLIAPLEPGRPLSVGASAPAKSLGATARAASRDAGEEPGAGVDELDGDPSGGSVPATREALARMFGVPVRVWAELGRMTLSLGSTLGLPPGSVLELEQGAEEPIELFVNGMRFAHGTLQVSSEGEWAVQIDALI